METISKIAKLRRGRVIFHNVFQLSERIWICTWREKQERGERKTILNFTLSTAPPPPLNSLPAIMCLQPSTKPPGAAAPGTAGIALRTGTCSLHLKYSWCFSPCSARNYIKERGRWMSDPCIWHLISATSDLGFDLVSLSQSLRKQSLLSSLNKFMHWRTIYLPWQFYYSEQWAFLVVPYFGFSLSSHVDKQKRSVWQLKQG